MSEHGPRIEDLIARYTAPAKDPSEYHALRTALWDGPDDEIARLRRGDGRDEDIEYGLAFLELDPHFFRSSYTKNRLMRHLSHASMNEPQRERARGLVLDGVFGRRSLWDGALPQLGGAVANNALRRTLRETLHRNDFSARRALFVLTAVRHPGYTPADIARAWDLVLEEWERRPWLGRKAALLMLRWWSPEWKAELEAIAGPHGPHRAAARDILSLMEGRRQRAFERRRAGP